MRLSNLNEDTTERDIMDLVSQFGGVNRVQVIKDRDTGESRGFCFITFYNKDSVVEAVQKLNGMPFNHMVLQAEKARPRTD